MIIHIQEASGGLTATAGAIAHMHRRTRTMLLPGAVSGVGVQHGVVAWKGVQMARATRHSGFSGHSSFFAAWPNCWTLKSLGTPPRTRGGRCTARGCGLPSEPLKYARDCREKFYTAVGGGEPHYDAISEC
jgi:hypothetical protein